MMYNKYRKLKVWFGILFLLGGCFSPPEFSVVPKISFKKLQFVDVKQASDSLVLQFNFEDGDGDIGLNPQDIYPPYHSFNVIFDKDLQPVFYNDQDFSLPLSAYNLYNLESEDYEFNGTLPPYGCKEYTTGIHVASHGGDTLIVPNDTVLIVQNEYNKNIYLNYYRKIQGDYIPINNEFSQGTCIEFFNSRIPVFDDESLYDKRALSGSISFAMLSQGFKSTFRNDTIQLRFYIYDRALNKSNVVESPDFVLSDITKD